MSENNKTNRVSLQDGSSISAVPLTKQILTEGFNLQIKNQSPPPRPTTQPVNPKK